MENNTTDDIELVYKVKNEQSSEAFEALLERHSGLFTKIVNKHFNIVSTQDAPLSDRYVAPTGQNFSLQDIIDDKVSIFYSSINGYEKDSGYQFNTWLGCQIRYYCLDLLNSNQKNTYQFQDVETMNFYIDSAFPVYDKRDYNEEINIIFDTLAKHRDPRVAKVFYAKTFLDKPYCNYHYIGNSLGVSYEYARLLFEKARKFLKEQNVIKELNFAG